jgi:hypothetical protein
MVAKRYIQLIGVFRNGGGCKQFNAAATFGAFKHSARLLIQPVFFPCLYSFTVECGCGWHSRPGLCAHVFVSVFLGHGHGHRLFILATYHKGKLERPSNDVRA